MKHLATQRVYRTLQFGFRALQASQAIFLFLIWTHRNYMDFEYRFSAPFRFVIGNEHSLDRLKIPRGHETRLLRRPRYPFYS